MNMKKVLALALAAVMVMALCGVAFAADGDLNIVITPQQSRTSVNGRTFSAYKLFDGVYSGTNNVAYTINPTTNAFYLDSTTKGILENYFTFTQSPTDANVMYVEPIASSGVSSNTRALANALAGNIPSGATAYTGTGDTTNCTIDVKAGGKGFYLVTGDVIPADPNNGTEPVVTAIALLNVKEENNNIAAKADTPPLTKAITMVSEGATEIPTDVLDADGKAAVAKVGAKVDFKLTSVVPDMTGYTTYEMIFTDTMDAGLTFNEDVALKIGSTTVDDLTGKYAKSGNGFTLTLDKTFLDTCATNATIEITYSATVNANSIEYDFEKNTANLQYSNNPYDSTTHDTTPDQHTYVINIKIDVLKYGATTADALAGAQFKLFKGTLADPSTWTYYKLDSTNGVTWTTEAASDTFETDATGAFIDQIKGLDQGTYYLVETKAPDGYNILHDPIAVTITATYDDTGSVPNVTYTSPTGATLHNEVIDLTGTHTLNASALATVEVQNQQGTELPSTGGIGTTIFYVSGLIMVLGAATILVARRKADAE